MTPSEKERIIKEGFDAIETVYNLRDDLLADAGKLEAARESNRKLSDRVANLEETIKVLNSAIDKKDVEIHRLNNRLKNGEGALLATIEALEKNRDAIYDNYLKLAHKSDADEEIKKHMIVDNYKKKEEIKSLKEELELLRKAHAKLCIDYDKLNKAMVAEVMGYATHDADEDIKKLKEEFESHQKAHAKLCEKYNNLCETTAVTEDKFHELRQRFSNLYFWYIRRTLELKDVIAFTDWFKDAFGDFGVYDEEE